MSRSPRTLGGVDGQLKTLVWSLMSGFLLALLPHAAVAQTQPRLDVIHKPDSGCPTDRVEVKGLFLELNGTHQDACVAHSTFTRSDLREGNVSFDYLMVGESIAFELVNPQPVQKSRPMPSQTSRVAPQGH